METLSKPRYLFSFPLSSVLTILQVLWLLLDRCEPLPVQHLQVLTDPDSLGPLNMIRPRFIFVPNVAYHMYII